jgi:hypothetical protein
MTQKDGEIYEPEKPSSNFLPSVGRSVCRKVFFSVLASVEV